MTKRKLSKASSSFLALALVLSVVIFAVPTTPAQASPAQTLTLELETITGSEGSFRALTLQAGDEVVQFTRDNVIIPSGGASGFFLTLTNSSYTVSGSLSGTILMEDNSISVDLPVAAPQRLEPPEGQEPLAEVDAFGFSVGKFKFDDGSGNTFGGMIASDWDIDSLGTGHHQVIVRGYMVSTEESGDFSGQKLIGTLAMKYQEPGFEILGATITLTRYPADEITSLGTSEFDGSFIEGFSRPIPTLTDDTLVQFTADNVALPDDGNTELMGGGVSVDIIGGPLTGTMTSEMNLVDYYLAGFGWVAGKFSIVDGSDTISGVVLVDMEAETGEGYMFALSGGTTTGIYAGKEYFATLSADVTAGVFTGSAEFMELTGAPVTFLDSNLEAAIREAIEVDGPIYASDLVGLSSLNAVERNITDLTGLEHCTSLTELSLRNNQISDIEPLVNNTGLSQGDNIDLRNNPLSTTSVDVYIPELVARGVEVLSDLVPEAPAADFSASPTSGTAPLTVRFTDQSTGGITDWEWDFDSDGRVDSTEQNPSHTYEFAGNYTVSLRVTGPGGEDIRVKSGIIMVKEKAEDEDGGGFDCVCSRVQAKTSPGELLIGWAVIGLCWGGGYYLVTRVNRRRRK